MSDKRVVRTVKLQIIKPLDRDWNALGKLLRDIRWRCWTLANEYITQRVIEWQAKKSGGWTGVKLESKPLSIDQLNQRLGAHLREQGEDVPGGAVNGYITGGLNQKLQALTRGHHWKSFTRGERSVPFTRLTMPIPLRGGEGRFEPLSYSEEHKAFLFRPRLSRGVMPGERGDFPLLLLKTPPKDWRNYQWLHNLVTNTDHTGEDHDGWRQRSFEIREDDKGRWWLTIAYDRPKQADGRERTNTCYAVIDYEVPMRAFCGKAILGAEDTSHLGHRIKSMRFGIARRRKAIQHGGRKGHSRDGHGRDAKLEPTEVLRHRIDRTQTQINRTLAKMLVKFALDNDAGTIVLEDTGELKDKLQGTFLGINWRYHDLHTFIEQHADDLGLTVKYVNAEAMEAGCGFKRTALEAAIEEVVE